MAAQAQGLRGLRMAVWGGAALLMLAAASVARLGGSMQWSGADFLLAGTILLAGCGLFELLMRRSGSWPYRAGALVAAATAVLLFLAAGAVGILGGENEPANLLFAGVIALAAAGALGARFRARGLARAMAVAAAAQVLAGIAGIAMVPDVKGFLLGTALFTPLWLLSAWLFARAARG